MSPTQWISTAVMVWAGVPWGCFSRSSGPLEFGANGTVGLIATHVWILKITHLVYQWVWNKIEVVPNIHCLLNPLLLCIKLIIRAQSHRTKLLQGQAPSSITILSRANVWLQLWPWDAVTTRDTLSSMIGISTQALYQLNPRSPLLENTLLTTELESDLRDILSTPESAPLRR